MSKLYDEDGREYEVQRIIGTELYTVKEDSNYWFELTKEGYDTDKVELFTADDVEMLVLSERLNGTYGYDTNKVAETVSLNDFLSEIGKAGYTLSADNIKSVTEITETPKFSDLEIQEFLKEEIEKYCDDNGFYEIYFDYRDSVEPDYLLKKFHEYENNSQGFEQFSHYFENSCYDDFELWHETDRLMEYILEDAGKKGIDFRDCIETHFSNDSEALEEAGYAGIAHSLTDLLKDDYKINIMLATKEETNYGMGAIPDVYTGLADGTYGNYESEEFQRELDNALTYLIHQQGHEVTEVVSGLADEHNESGFVASVIREIQDCPNYSMMEVAVSVHGSGQELLDVLDRLASGKGNLEISKDSSVSLFNEWQGTCSNLEIELETPLIVPVDMVRNTQIEGRGTKNEGCTLDGVCGLAGEFWKGEVSVTEEQPELIKEDISAIREALIKLKEKQEMEYDD